MNIIVAFSFSIVLLLSACRDDGPTDGGKQPCPPNDLVPMPSYTDPIWHPSGKFIGFNHTPLDSITYPNGEQCQGQQHFNWREGGFWLMDTNGTNMRRIFPYTLQTPAWSPDGEWIAFVGWMSGDPMIYRMRFTGSGFDTTTLQQLTFAGRNFHPAWSPAGQWIAYDATYPEGYAGIWIIPTSGFGNLSRRVASGRYPDWSPTSTGLIYIGLHSEIYHVYLNDTLPPSRLTSWNQSNRYTTDIRSPKYSPDGTKIVFWSQPNPGAGNLWLMDTLGNNLHKLTTEGVDGSFGRPFTWNPDGRKIILTRYYEKWTCDNGVFWLLEMETGMKQQLTFNCSRSQ